MQDFFDGFCINKLVIGIKRNPAAEVLSLAKAPARIIKRRGTTAVDKSVEMHQILDPNVAPMEPFQPFSHHEPIEQVPVSVSRVVSRRKTVDEKLELQLDPEFKELLSRRVPVVNAGDHPIELGVNADSVPADDSTHSEQGENGDLLPNTLSNPLHALEADASDQPLDLRVKAKIFQASNSAHSKHGENEEFAKTFSNSRPERYVPRQLTFAVSPSNVPSPNQHVGICFESTSSIASSSSIAVDCREQMLVNQDGPAEANLSKKPLPDLMPISNLENKENEQVESIPNFATNPMQFAEYVRKSIEGLSDTTNIQK